MSSRFTAAGARPGGLRRAPAPPAPAAGPVRSNAVFGTLVFLGAEAMLFAGLVSSFLVLRGGAPVWPPPGQPRLPVVMTALNTVVLLLSGWTMMRAVRAARDGDATQVERRLLVTAGLGAVFLAVQGVEWIRLVAHGLTLSPGVYAGLFVALIGTHGAHVLGGVVVLAAVWLVVWRGRATDRLRPLVTAASCYWLFVVGVWPVLYGLVYLW